MTGNEPLWADAAHDWRGLARLDKDLHADLCVVGLGGSGLAAAAAGLAAGARVVGIDAGDVAGRAAGRNGGLLLAGMAPFHHEAVARFGRDLALRWYRATQRELHAIVDDAGPTARRVGSLRVAADEDEAADIAAQLAAMRADDLPVEAWEDADHAGILFPDDAVCNPLARCRHLADRLLAGGATLLSHSPAVAIRPGRVTTPGGEIHCGQVVVAIDGALAEVLPELRGRVRPVRLQMLGTGPAAISVPVPVYARHGLDYWQQLPDGRLAVGGGRDRGGDAEETDDPAPTPAVQSWLDELLARLDPSVAVTHRWGAVVGFTDDGLPIAEQVRDRVWAVGGYSGTGNVIGSLLGRLAATAALHGSSAELDALYARGATRPERPGPSRNTLP